MSKIVELKVEEIENVVGGIMAGTLSANANVRVPSHGPGANRPPMPAPESTPARTHNKR